MTVNKSPDPNTAHPPEIIYVTGDPIACNGGDPVIGHPTVYLTLDNHTHSVDCNYCDRRYVLKTNPTVSV